MNQSKQKMVRDPIASRSPFAAGIYYIISILLFPVQAAGYILWIIKMLQTGRGSGVSGTAQGPLSARWFQHKLGVRQDEASSRLMMALPGISPLALHLVFGPMLVAHRVSGYLPGSLRYPFEGEVSMQVESLARQTFFDSVVERYIPGIAQFVILGAGYDTRAFRPPSGAQVRSFEVDTPQTQATKREMLKKAGIDSAEVTFVSADFEKEDWLCKLVDAGFDPSQPALFLWEGVIMYLDRAAVEDSLRKIASTARGSLVAFDYMTTEPLESQGLYWRYARMGTRANGEPLKFGVDSTPPSRERLAELLCSCGLTLTEQRTLGQETAVASQLQKRAFGGFAIATVE